MKINNNVLTAEKGKLLTNGEAFGKTVRIGRCGNASNWHEITKAEYEKILKEQEEKMQ